jgi:23S rRNA pseudouridine2605 synthase
MLSALFGCGPSIFPVCFLASGCEDLAMKSKNAVTLDRVLSRFGLASRTESRQAILDGRIKVNGRVVRDPDRWVRAETDVFHLDGKRLRPARRLYLLFYKPKGVITSHGDPDCRKTIYDYLDPSLAWVSPVGRLDKDTSGLLLLTNDTEFANFVASPDSRVPKTYLVKLNAVIDDETLTRLAAGVKMKRGDWARPQTVRRVEDRGKYSWLEVVLTEGKNREVRRMLEAIGFTVLKLVRTRIGPLTLEGLEIGNWRELGRNEIASLKRIQKPEFRSRKPE